MDIKEETRSQMECQKVFSSSSFQFNAEVEKFARGDAGLTHRTQKIEQTEGGEEDQDKAEWAKRKGNTMI